MRHLEATSTLSVDFMTSRDFEKVLREKLSLGQDWSAEKLLAHLSFGAELRDLWSTSVHNVTLTSVGQLIGVMVHDSVSGSTTIIKW